MDDINILEKIKAELGSSRKYQAALRMMADTTLSFQPTTETGYGWQEYWDFSWGAPGEIEKDCPYLVLCCQSFRPGDITRRTYYPITNESDA